MSIDWLPNDGKYLEEEKGAGWLPSEKVRLFPNDPRIRFANPVHELVEDSVRQAGIKIKKTGIPVHHYGKLDRKKTEAKRNNYYELGKIKLDQRGEQDIHALYELATQATQIGNYTEALEYWQKLTMSSPHFVKGFMGLATVYCDLGKYREAVSAMRTAMELAPDSREAITLYAICEACAGNSAASIAPLESLLTREPMHPLALGLLASAYFCLNRKNEGFAVVKKLQNTNIDAAGFFLSFAKQLIDAQQHVAAATLLETAAEAGYMNNEISRIMEETKGKMNIENLIPEDLGDMKSMKEPFKKQADVVEKETADASAFQLPAGPAEESEDLLLSVNSMTAKLNEKGAKVSLIIPVSTQSGDIGEYLDAVRQCTPEPHEVILVQNGPSDGLNSRFIKLADEYPDCKIVNEPVPQGKINYAETCNRGVKASTGKYLVVLDDDVMVSFGWLTGMLECAMAAPDTGIVGPMIDRADGPQGVNRIAASLSGDRNAKYAKTLSAFAVPFRQTEQIPPYRGQEASGLLPACQS